MHLAFLGLCPESHELAVAAASLGHRITWYVTDRERGDAASQLSTSRGTFESQDTWESLLDAPDVDGIVLAEADEDEVELRSEQWRRLAQAGASILLVHPVVPSLLVYLEVDMLARESRALLLPFWQSAYSEPAKDLQVLAAGADYGLGQVQIEQIGFRRHLEIRSPLQVTRWFARDVALLDLLAGPFSDIGAMGPDASDASYATLAVQLDGPRGVPVRWEVVRAVEEEVGVLTATGPDLDVSKTFAELHRSNRRPDEGDPYSHRPTAEVPGSVRDSKSGAAGEAFEGIMAFQELIQGHATDVESWQRCVRAMELADSIEISLRRGRRIEVHYRQLTEETSYKGLMSAVGCGLLLLAPLVLVVAGMLQAVFGWRLMRFWYAPILVLFVAFLIVQLLARFAAQPGGQEP